MIDMTALMESLTAAIGALDEMPDEDAEADSAFIYRLLRALRELRESEPELTAADILDHIHDAARGGTW